MRSPSPLPLFIFWCFLVGIAPSSVYWRDSGEFIVQAYALDIAHPAGFPTYAQVANLFTLIPLGPIAWRVVLVSSLSLIGICVALFAILKELTAESELSLSQRILAVLTLVTMLPVTIKQAQSAEVYLLNGVFILAIMVLLLRGLRLQDRRFLFSTALLGGLAIGNHISAILSGGFIAIVLTIISGQFRRSLPYLTLFFLIGLSIYSYLPLRASTTLPLNTGSPNTLTRFWQVISDGRDRELRRTNDLTQLLESSAGFEKLIPNPLANFENDLKKIGLFNPLALAILVSLSLLYMLIKHPTSAIILTAAGAGNYIFFSGWDGDPWVVAIAVLVALLFSVLQDVLGFKKILPSYAQALVSWGLVAIICWQGELLSLGAAAIELRNYQTPSNYAQNWLNASSAPVVVTENSWFLTRYLSDIEGSGDNRLIVYQPSILFPDYFAPVAVDLSDVDTFDSANIGGGELALGIFTTKTTKDASLLYEPSKATNQALSAITVLKKSGASEISRGIFAESAVDPRQSAILDTLKLLTAEASSSRSFIRGDVANFRDNILSAHLDLWEKQQRGDYAIDFIDSICAEPESKQCSPSILNQRGLLLLKLKKYGDAAEYYRRLVSLFPAEGAALTKNYSLAKRLASEAISQTPDTNS